MPRLEDTVQLALDELRMQMLGVQVLFGFQLQSAFQEGFASASAAARTADAVALSLIVVTLALLIAAPCQHRLVEQGRASVRIFNAANKFADRALAPFALAIGCDVYAVTERYWGIAAAALGAAFAAAGALFLLYGLGRVLRLVVPRKEQEMALPAETATDLHHKIDQMLTESRVILPGAQALLGFQFVVTMTKAFAELPPLDRAIHFTALIAVMLAAMLLLTPAAVHRITFKGRDVERFHDIGSMVQTVALAPLALGVALDFYVAIARMLGDRTLAAAGAGTAALLLIALWYGLPLMLRTGRA